MKILNKLIIGFIFIAIIIIIFLIFRGNEDSWIKNEKGIYVKHGNPSQIPDDALKQQDLINKTLKLYQQENLKGIEFFSQCLGVIDGYAIDVVHVPRIEEDNLAENQCDSFRSREVLHFIEIDQNGNIVRIV